MPVISVFFGIIIRMWHDDHPPPHIHVSYQGFEALVEIGTGRISKGKLPVKAAQLVTSWCSSHYSELMANWQRGENFEPMQMIQGADYD